MENKDHRGVMMMMMMMGLGFSETMENEDHKVYGLEKQWGSHGDDVSQLAPLARSILR